MGRVMPELRDPAVHLTNPSLLTIYPQWDLRGGTAPFTVEQKRQSYLAGVSRAGTPEPVDQIADRTVDGPGGAVPIRVYRPQPVGKALLPVLLYLHGGGFVSGDLDTHDPICRTFANRIPAVVVAVNYRLAPEHLFPAAHQDCYAVLSWLAEHAATVGGAPDKLFIAGDSAGGLLVAALALQAKAAGTPTLAAQVLIYPMLDATLSSPSLVTNALMPPFTLVDCVHVWQMYLGTDSKIDRCDPRLSPLLASDLASLPPALVITAGLDILVDEGQRYASRLRSAGVPVEEAHFAEMVHGFFQWGGMVLEARTAMDCAVKFLQDRVS